MKNEITAKKLVEILGKSLLKEIHPKIYEKYYEKIENLLYGLDDSVIKDLSSLEGLTDETSLDRVLREKSDDELNPMFFAIHKELRTWKKNWSNAKVEEYYRHISNDKDNNGQLEKVIDGETISHLASLIPAFFVLLISAVLIVLYAFGIIKNIDYDAVGFIAAIVTALALVIVSVVAKIYNSINRKKFNSAHEYSLEEIVAAKNRNNGKKFWLSSFKTTGLLIVAFLAVIGMIGLTTWYFVEQGFAPQVPEKPVIECDGFDVFINEDGETVTVSINTQKEGTEIEFPSKILHEGKAYRVTRIGKAVMAENDKIKSINMTTSIERIEDGAFTNFSSLEKISIPESVTYIGNAFSGCTMLERVNINSLKAWCNIDFDGDNANPLSQSNRSVLMIGNQALVGEISLGEDVLAIPDYTFRNTLVEKVRLYDPIKFIGKDIFVNCQKLDEAILPANLAVVPEGTFYGCGDLTKLTVPFVGGYSEPRKEEPSSLFGYIFGEKEYENSILIQQSYGFSSETIEKGIEFEDKYFSVSSIPSEWPFNEQEYKVHNLDFRRNMLEKTVSFFLPAGLCEVSVLNGNIFGGAFSIVNDFFNGGEVLLDNDIILSRIVLKGNVSSIGIGAFFGCKNLNSFEIPENTERIGASAFALCGLSGLLKIPNKVSYIGSRAFMQCTDLEVVEIGESVEFIGAGAFQADGINVRPMKVFFGKNVTRVCGLAFNRPIEGVYITDMNAWCRTKFDSYYFFGNYPDRLYYSSILNANPLSKGKHLYLNGKLVKQVSIPGDITELIGTFTGAVDIESITISNSLITIGDYSFHDCTSLTNIEIPSGVTDIGNHAFNDCIRLTSITIPDSVKRIGDYAFNGCSGLKEVHITDLAAWCEIAFGGFLGNPLSYAHHLFMDGEEITKLEIPHGVTSIGDWAFRNCSELTSISIPDSVEAIGNYAFDGCSGLTLIIIPKSVKSIGSWAFDGCTNLTIYCEASEQPSGWNENWNPRGYPVVWGFKKK